MRVSSFGGNSMGDVLSRHREGWMNKKGGSRRNWKRRWFVLQVVDDGAGSECPMLCYYEGASDAQPLGQIDLRNTEIANSHDPAMLSKHPHAFEIVHPGARVPERERVFVFCFVAWSTDSSIRIRPLHFPGMHPRILALSLCRPHLLPSAVPAYSFSAGDGRMDARDPANRARLP